LKPHNVMLVADDDEVDVPKILDFGIAQMRERPGVTMPGMVMGTPTYMAPEQFLAGGEVDARSDLYSLGVILYEMLAGEVPFTATSALAILFKHMIEPPPVPSLRFPNLTISPALETIALRCLEKEPDKRFQTADEFAAALDAVPIASASPPPGIGVISADVTVPIARPGTPTPALATPKPASARQLAPTVPMRPMAPSPVRPTVAAPASQPPPSPAGGTRPTVPAAGTDHVAPSAANTAALIRRSRRADCRVFGFPCAPKSS
jgi:serine/threonine-protein kinase